ncbi:hypothetical protein [Planctomicrobium sp. SH664]|uniref:hypothetical protein n=1 Tax=Planctomicrobium sp. SH664 TaxID=3448125 RepID=UPI003F5B3835
MNPMHPPLPTPEPEEDRLAQAGRILLHLQQQLAELDRREQDCQHQLGELIQREKLFQRTRAVTEKRLAEGQRELDERTRVILEAESLLNARAEHLQQREQEVQNQFDQLQRDRETFRQTQLEQSAAREAQLAAERDQLLVLRGQQAEIPVDQRQADEVWLAQRQQEREEFQLELAELRREKLSSLDQRERELERREIDSRKRFRFHEAHLDKMRIELATRRAEMERERQQHRVWINQVDESLRLRLAQLQRFRSLLDERETLLVQEQQSLHKQLNENESRLSADRALLQRERHQWLQLCDQQLPAGEARDLLLLLHASQTEFAQRLDDLTALEENWRQKREAWRLEQEQAEQRLQHLFSELQRNISHSERAA